MNDDMETRIREVLAEDASCAPVSEGLAARARGLVRRRRRRQAAAWCGGAAAVAVLVGTLAVAQGAGIQPKSPSTQAGTAVPSVPASTTPSPEATQSGAVPLPQSGLATCSIYSPEGVFRDLNPTETTAFDGTVTKIDPSTAKVGGFDSVSLSVNAWYSGGSGAKTTIQFPTGFSIDPGPPPYEVGTRLLVSGFRVPPNASEGPVRANGCGFTRYYDASTAQDWERASN